MRERQGGGQAPRGEKGAYLPSFKPVRMASYTRGAVMYGMAWWRIRGSSGRQGSQQWDEDSRMIYIGSLGSFCVPTPRRMRPFGSKLSLAPVGLVLQIGEPHGGKMAKLQCLHVHHGPREAGYRSRAGMCSPSCAAIPPPGRQ